MIPVIYRPESIDKIHWQDVSTSFIYHVMTVKYDFLDLDAVDIKRLTEHYHGQNKKYRTQETPCRFINV